MQSFPQHLIDGYAAFIRGPYAEAEGKYKTLAKEGQSPTTMVIACCDSRAAPEPIFDAGPGELFVLRNVGNLVPTFQPDGGQHGTSAGIEFAVAALEVENLVVLGHGRCGGIRAALNPGHALAQGDFIGKWIRLVQPAFEALGPVPQDGPLDGFIAKLELEAIRQSLANLRTFPCISTLEQRGLLQLHGAYFGVMDGKLLAYDEASGQFNAIAADAHAVALKEPRF